MATDKTDTDKTDVGVTAAALSAAAQVELRNSRPTQLYDVKVVELTPMLNGVSGVIHEDTNVIARDADHARAKALLAAGKKDSALEDKEYKVHVTCTFCVTGTYGETVQGGTNGF